MGIIVEYVLEAISAVVCASLVIVMGVRARKRGENSKAVLWFTSVPVVAFAGFWLAVLVVLAAGAILVIWVVVLVGDISVGTHHKSDHASGFEPDARVGSDGRRPTTATVFSATMNSVDAFSALVSTAEPVKEITTGSDLGLRKPAQQEAVEQLVGAQSLEREEGQAGFVGIQSLSRRGSAQVAGPPGVPRGRPAHLRCAALLVGLSRGCTWCRSS